MTNQVVHSVPQPGNVVTQTDESYELIIEAGRAEQNYWRDIWAYRELFLFLAWRDIVVRYKQTVIGILWALLRPFLTMFIFTFVFGRLAHLDNQVGPPYALIVMAGLLPWQFFSSSFSEASASLVSNSNMISKIYFPRIIIPATSLVVSFVDLLISMALLAFLMIWYHFLPSWQVIFLPIFVILASLASLGAGIWIAALNVKYRDFRVLVPFILQFGLYASPVGFDSSIVPAKWRPLFSLNPMVGVIDGFRWSLLGGKAEMNYFSFASSAIISLFLFSSSVWFFRKTEKTFADII